MLILAKSSVGAPPIPAFVGENNKHVRIFLENTFLDNKRLKNSPVALLVRPILIHATRDGPPPPPDPPSTSAPTFEGENISLVSYLFQEKNSKTHLKLLYIMMKGPLRPIMIRPPPRLNNGQSGSPTANAEAKGSLKPSRAMGGAAHGHDKELHPPRTQQR